MNLIIIIIYVFISSLGMILIKDGGHNNSFNISTTMFGFNVSWKYILGLSLYVVSFILWTIILQKYKVTYISPVAYGAVYLCILVMSNFILHEKPSPTQLIGGIIIVLGVLLASVEKVK